jgi:hypothetical protein
VPAGFKFRVKVCGPVEGFSVSSSLEHELRRHSTDNAGTARQAVMMVLILIIFFLFKIINMLFALFSI